MERETDGHPDATEEALAFVGRRADHGVVLGHRRTIVDEGVDPVTDLTRLRPRCSCGWACAVTSTRERADVRWRVHVLERRSAAWIEGALAQQDQMRRRSVELLLTRESARRRRRTIRVQRVRVRQSLDRARGTAGHPTVPEIGAVLDNAREVLGWSVAQVWWAYFELGGLRSEEEVAAMLAVEEPVDDADRALLVTALNEQFALEGDGHPLLIHELGA